MGVFERIIATIIAFILSGIGVFVFFTAMRIFEAIIRRTWVW